MFGRPIDRRVLMKGAASLAVMVANLGPAFAAPSIKEVTFDPAIPALGNPNGDVTIAEFVDYQCPVCKLVFIELRKLMAEDRGIRLVMKDWPIFGDASRDAALMALSSGSRYAAAVDALMANRRALSPHRTDAILDAAGANSAGLRAELAGREPKLGALLARTQAQASAFELRGTPALVIGGKLYRRGMPVAELRQAVATARAG
ncbi:MULTISPECIES: thioredoxin domain-containing protein [unclassified Mesorhizobium]|uniref:thioredoxin domain-containing protein n=1 Tax=unclassified Mesorhizobium TaxID=325217 RepID=UPI0015E37E4D|nr:MULTISPECIES: thioredoxin domain-containing protein [unclassified Mesorhizobium]